MRRSGAIPAFCLSKKRGGTPQNLRWSKQRKGLRKRFSNLKICGGVNKEKGCVKGFRKTLAIIYCEQTVNFDFSMDIGWNIGVNFLKTIMEVAARKSETHTRNGWMRDDFFFCPTPFSHWAFAQVR